MFVGNWVGWVDWVEGGEGEVTGSSGGRGGWGKTRGGGLLWEGKPAPITP